MMLGNGNRSLFTFGSWPICPLKLPFESSLWRLGIVAISREQFNAYQMFRRAEGAEPPVLTGCPNRIRQLRRCCEYYFVPGPSQGFPSPPRYSGRLVQSSALPRYKYLALDKHSKRTLQHCDQDKLSSCHNSLT